MFENNLANHRGGAVFHDGNGTVTLDTGIYDSDNKLIGSGDIAFTGNKVNGAANSVYLHRGTKLDLKGDGNIYFDDPISVGQDGGNSLVKSGSGFVQFLGANVLNNTTGTAGRVEVKGGGTLAGNGTIIASQGIQITGTLKLLGNTQLIGATLAVDIDGTSNDKIAVTGDVSNFNPLVTVMNQASADFLSASAYLDASVDDQAMQDLINGMITADAKILLGLDTLRGSKLHADAQSMALWNPWDIVYKRLYSETAGNCVPDTSANAALVPQIVTPGSIIVTPTSGVTATPRSTTAVAAARWSASTRN